MRKTLKESLQLLFAITLIVGFSSAAKADDKNLIAEGKKIYMGQGGVMACNMCHSIDGKRLVGPSFKGLYGSKRTVTVGGKDQKVKADDAYFIESIKTPNAKVAKGFPAAMPPAYAGMTPAQMKAIIAYIKTLK